MPRRALLPCIAACAGLFASAQPPPPNSAQFDKEKAERLRSQSLFEGGDDTDIPTAEEFRARLAGMCVDASSAVLGYAGLTRAVPPIASDQPLTPALVYGSDFFMLFFQTAPPSAQKGNYYAMLTLRQDPLDREGRNYQQRLESEILASPRKLQPADVARMALRATHGNYPLAMLTAHNLLKEITEKGRDEAYQNAVARSQHPRGREWLPDIGIDPRFGRFASKFVTLRNSASTDKMGPWYHFFVPLAAEAWASRHSAFWMEAFEHGARRTGFFANDDREKQRLDECALRAAYAVNSGLSNRTDPQEQPAQPSPAAPPAPAPPPKGGILVEVQNSDLWNLNAISKITFVSEGGRERNIINLPGGEAEEVPVGRYTVSVDAGPGYALAERKGVAVTVGETARLLIKLASTDGRLNVTVGDETGASLKGIDVAISGPQSVGPRASPALFEVPAGNYRVIVPKSVVNGKYYRGKEAAATVTADRTTAIAIALEPFPPSPRPAQARSVSIEPGWLDLKVNDDYELLAKVYDEQGQVISGASVTWSSTAPSIAAVDQSGKVAGRGRGQAQIVASSGAARGAIPVKVTSDAALSTCAIADHPSRIPTHGSGFVFKAVARDVDGKALRDVVFTWSGSNYVVALVNSKTGSITAETPGDVTVFAQGKAPDGSEVSCFTDITVEKGPQDVLVSGQVVRSDGSAAPGASVRAANGPAAIADSEGNFIAIAGPGTYPEGGRIKAQATLGTAAGEATGFVRKGAVEGLRIALGAPGAAAASAPAATKGRIDAHLFRLWPPDNPKEVGFLLYVKSEKDRHGNFGFPDGSGGMYWKAGEDLGFYRDEDSVCAVLRGYGQTGATYNLGWSGVSCPKDGPIARPRRVGAGSPDATPTAGSGIETLAAVTLLTGFVTYSDLAAPGATRPLRQHDRVGPGASLDIGKGSRVSLTFPGGNVAHVGELSKVRISSPRKLELPQGSVELEHPAQPAAERRESEPSFGSLEVATPDAGIVPTGTRYKVSVSGRGSGFEVLEGTARVTGSMLARTDAAFNVAGKPSFVKEFDLQAGDRVFAFRVPSWAGGDVRTAAAAPLARPDPWNDSQIQQHIDEWLRAANPEAAATRPGPWRYSDWAVLVGPGVTVAGPPDHPSGWSRYQTVWSIRTKLPSLNLCTLGEYVERRIGNKSLEGCARGGASRAAVPSWMAPPSPVSPAKPSPTHASPLPGAAPPNDPLTKAREQLAHHDPPPQSGRPLDIEGAWRCAARNTILRQGTRSAAASQYSTLVHFAPGNALLLDERGGKVAPRYVRGNTIGYTLALDLWDVHFTLTYDLELSAGVLTGTGKVEGADGTSLTQTVTCSDRYHPKR